MDTFQALVARQDGDRITAAVETLEPSELLDQVRAGAFSGRAVVRVAGGF
jgi:hypothetical protein